MSSADLAIGELPAYMAITAHGGRRVILPVGAAGRSRLLHDLLEGLHVMSLAVGAKCAGDDGSATGGGGGGSASTPTDGALWMRNDRKDLYTMLIEAEARQQQQQQEGPSGAATRLGASPVSFSGGGEEDFTCYARVYPMFHRAMPREGSSGGSVDTASKAEAATDRSGNEEGSSDDAVDESSPLVEVPLRCVEGDTVARIAHFLVLKACAAVQPHHAGNDHKVDPLADLDCTSQNDQLTAIRLLLGSDLLGC